MPEGEYKEFSCDLCGESDSIEIPHCRKYTTGEAIDICRNCGFVYVKSRRSASAIADNWSDSIFGSGYTATIPAVKARLTFVAEFIESNIGLSNKLLCDIGAGEGEFLRIIKDSKYGSQVFGIEPSQNNCRLIKGAGIECFSGTIEQFLETPESANLNADIVTIMWTLENCQSARAMLSGAYRILKDDGYIVMATGSRILVPFKKPLDYYFSKNPADTHSFRFSYNTLRGILAVSNFEVSHVNRYIDSDILCMIARKTDGKKEIRWDKDNYLDVYNFFERWHVDTNMYYSS